jgi:hypothetical protein
MEFVHQSTIRKSNSLKSLLWLTPIGLYLFLVVNGWLGVNFGTHWDEHLFVEFADDFHIHGRLIPTLYLYPSFCYYLILLSAEIFRLLHPGLANVPSLLQNNDFSVFSRCVFVCIASLTVVWVYILTLKITNKYRFALLAGLIFCGSFEFSYHSRWAVSDLIAVQFAFLSTLMLFLDMSVARRIFWSACVAGIAAGTKYTAGIVCLNTLIFMAANLQPWESKDQQKAFIRQLCLMGAVFAIAFFITTPGCIYHMKTFFRELQAQRNIYAGGHVLSDTVNPGWEHFSKIMAYFVLALFSPLPAASIAISILCLAGVVSALLKQKWNILALFLVMFIYVIYVSTFRVMIVRNLLYVLPYFVVLAAYGLSSLHEFAGNKRGILAVDAALLCLIVLSLHFIVAASWSVHTKDSTDMKKNLALYLKEYGENRYVLSKGAGQLLPSGYEPVPVADNSTVYLVFLMKEVQPEHYPKIAFNRYTTIAGPRDVNFDYYPVWSGADRIVIVKFKNANREMLDDLGMAMNP